MRMRFFTPLVCIIISLFAFAASSFGQVAVVGNDAPLSLDGHQQRQVITATSPAQLISFYNLIPGETYVLVAPEDQAMNGCWPSIEVPPSVEGATYDAAVHSLTFKATAETMSFKLVYPCTWSADNPPRHYISLVCQTCSKKKLKDFMESMAVLEVQGGQPAEDLVRDVLIGGNCFDITGITYSGQGGQIGTFSNGLTNVGFNTGMIMATGDVSVAPGPNDQDNASAGYGVSTPDGDLTQLSGSGALFDRANIEFDFTPTQTPLTFEFVFASEEYCEYVGSQFNDAFGFFVSGPGISGPFGGAANIAVIPMTSTYVAINNINHLTNSGLYVNNQPASSSNLCGQTASFAAPTNELQFDGYTRKMIAVANVQPCQTYHIRLKICDVGDGIFDSAVFLKSGSFDAGGNASVEWLVNNEPADDTYEGCGTVKLHFERVGGNPNVAINVPYLILGTATNGLDYNGIPGSVTIPAGSSEVFINVNIINDLITEGDETIIIKLTNPCSCLEPQEILTIHDLPVLQAVPDTVTICGSGVGTVGVTPTSGVDPYTYHWSTGSTEQSISPFVNISTNYTVTVTDACGKTVVRTARVIVNPPPTAQLLPPAPQLCPGGSATLNVNFNGVGPFTLEYNLNGDPQPAIIDITDDPYQFSVNQAGLYQITAVYDGSGCQGPGQGALLVTLSTLAMTGVTTNVKCNGQSNGSINTTVTGGQGPYTYAWTGPQPIGNIADPTNLQAGQYDVVVTDNFGCSQAQQFTISAPNAIVPTIANVLPVNCTNPNGGSINLEVTGGSPAYTYSWTGGFTMQDPTGLGQGTYTVTITDQNTCTKTTSATVPGDFATPTAVAAAPDAITCTTTSVGINGNGSSTGANFSYQWTGGSIVSGATTLTPIVNMAATYTLKVTNTTNGCTSTATVTVNSNTTLPTAAAGPDQTLTCTLTNATLNGAGSSSGPNFNYFWTASGGGTILAGNTTLNPIVSTTGTYTLLVTNTANGCTKTDVAIVNANVTAPNASIVTPGQLTCIANPVTLNGSGSTPSGSLTYQWSTSNGNILSGQTSANASINEPGQYLLVVTNTANGCTDDQTVTVTQDYSYPLALAAPPATLNCVTSQITIDGSGSSTGPMFTFQWTASPGGQFVSGSTTLNPTVNAPGTYTLVVTNIQNGCTSVESVQVQQDLVQPAASAGQPNTLTCATTTLVLGNPAAPTGPNLNYTWTTSAPGNIQSGGNTPTPTINQPGTYNLLVTNTQNGCTNTASVVIPQNITLPTVLVAPGGELNCTTPALLLNANGTSTGANFSYNWTSASGNGIGAGGTTLTPTVTVADTYTLLVTNTQNGCTNQASTTVTSNANLPTVLIATPTTFTCTNQQIALDGTGSTTGPTMAYQWGTVNGVISSGQNTLTAVAGAPGTYTLLVTNTANNCTSTLSVDVPADLAVPAASAGPSAVLDCTQPAFTLDGSASSQGSNFTYQWTAVSGGNFTSPTNIASPQVNEAGTYQILVTNTTNGCTASATVDIVQDANDPVVLIAPPGILNCTNSQQLILNANGSSAGAGISYAWTGPSIASGGTSLTPTVTQPGNYTLVITNTTNGCSSSETVPVTLNVQAPPVDAGPDGILNCTAPQQQIGGPGNPTGVVYSFSWAGPGIVSGGNSPAPIIDQGGAYVLTVTDTTNGCTSTDAVNMATDFVAPTADAGTTFQLTCVNTSYTLTSNASQGPNFVYSWTTNGGSFTTPTNILSPTVDAPGQYYLSVTNTTNGCTATDDVQITKAADVPTAIAATPGPLTCTNQTLTLSGTGSSSGANYTYQWMATNGGSIVSGGTSLNPLVDEPGTYTIAVTDNTNNCVSYSSINVTEDVNAPVMDAGTANLLTCTQLSVGLQATVSSNGSFTYQWVASNGGNIVSGNTSLTPTVNATGDYSLTVTNTVNGCTSTDLVQVQADQVPPVATIVMPNLLTCAAQQVTLDATASSGGAMQYDWSTINGHYSNLGDVQQPQVDQPGTYNLLITNPGNGCTATTSVTVGQDVQAPVAQAGNNGLITCATTSVQLDGTGSSQGGNYFYQWTGTNGGQILVGANSLTPTVIAGGTYTLVVVNNSNGCQSSDLALVSTDTQNPTVAIGAPGLITCILPQVPLVGTSTPSGASISYSWTSQTGGGIVGGQNAATAMVNAAGNYTLSVLNTANGCSASTNVDVSENIVLPLAEAGPPATLTCSIEQIVLQGVGSSGPIYSYVWTTPSGQILNGGNSLQPTVNQPGVYSLLVTNTNTGCTKSDDVEIFKETNVPTGFDYALTKPGCKDDDGEIVFGQIQGGIGPYVYSINNGTDFTPELDFASIQPGSYDLVIQDVNGCEFHQPLVVPKAPDPAVTLTPDIQIDLGDSLRLEASLPAGYPVPNIASVTWTPLDGLTFNGTDIISLLRPWARPFKTTEYKVTVVSKDGCEATDRILVRVDNEPHIYIPNAFSPWDANGDNDIFYISADGDQILRIKSFHVFDRWGEMMFVNQDFQPNIPGEGWDGRLSGKLLDPAVFVYMAEIELIDGRVILYKGDVTLVR